MPRIIPVKCTSCSHQFEVDLDDYQAERTLYRGEKKEIKVEEYRFKCPRDGTYFIVPVTIEE